VAFHCACLLGAYFFALPHSSGVGSVFHQRPTVISVLWYFAVCFSILQDSLTLGAIHWFGKWSLWSATCPASGSGLSPACCQPSCLSSVYLLMVHAEISIFPLPLSPVHFEFSCHSPVVLGYSFLFVIQVFLGGLGGHSAQGLCWFIPGVAGRIPCNTWHSPVWSVKCLTGRFWAMVAALMFFQYNMCGVAFHQLGFRVSKACSLVLYFHQVWLQLLRTGLESWSLGYLLPYPSCHFGSPINISILNLKQ
jgi:hypothetical protein